MSESTNTQIPQIRPTQFESDVSSIFKDSVNLFRGDVNLSLDLVSLKGRNGLDVKVTASYGSNVKSEIRNSNVNKPTSILGLGWQLPFDRIEVESRDNASVNDNLYYLYTNNTSTELVSTTSIWVRATLPESAAETLNQGQVDDAIQSQFIDSGLALDINAEVEVVTNNQQWIISDRVNQRVFKIENQASNLKVLAGGEAFECFQYDFSQILYYPQFERWELVKDDGTSYFYGGNAQNQNPIQYKVKWGNWSGESALSHDSENTLLQSPYPFAWNLVSVEDIWGDTISFSYDIVEQQVGDQGLSFTKACYLSQITDMFNRTIDFNYGEKQYNIDSPASPREYMSPHWNDPYTQVPTNEPSPYQDRYETRYLDHIVVNNPQGVMLYMIQLSYDIGSNFSDYSQEDYLYGDTVKRTLTRIQRVFAHNCSMPSLDFSYWSAGSVNAGALRGAVTPDGATINYQYKQQSLPLCDRQKQITNPWPGSAKPRVWFGSDYVVNLWLNESTNQIHVTLYTWLGRWQQWAPSQQIIQVDGLFDINRLNVLTTEDFACLSYPVTQQQKSYVHIYHKDNRKWGEWLETDPITVNTTNLQVAAGDNFLIACDQENRILLRYTWDCFSKVWIIEDVSTELELESGTPYITAANKHYAILDYAKLNGGERHNRLTLYYQDSNYQWHTGASETLTFTIGGYDPDNSFGFNTSASFIAITYITNEVSASFNYTVKVLAWDESFGAITSHDFSYRLPKSTPSYQITTRFIAQFVNNSMIASGPHLLRYNGSSWLQNSSLDFRDTYSDKDINWYAYGADYAIYTSNREYAVQSKLVGYDPTTNITSWDNQAVELYTKDSSTSGRKRRYFPTAGADIATMDNRIYHRGSQQNWQDAVGEYQEVSEGIDSTTMINQGPRFISYLNIDDDTAQDTSLWPLLNQSLNTEETIAQRYFTQISTVDGSVKQNINGKYPSGLSTFVTYLPLNKDFDDAETITLNRYLDNTLQGTLVDFCVDSMSINDGYTTNTTKYVFDIDTATCDPTGAVLKYYKSRYYPGTDAIEAPAYGYTENSYFNGLTQQNTEGYQQVLAQDTAASGLLDGQLIEQKVFDANGKLLVHEQKQIQAFTAIAADGTIYNLFGGYIRCITNTTTNDGLIVTTDYEYDSRFGKLTQEKFDNITRDGTVETVYKNYSYAFAAYPWFLEKNVIDVPFTQYESVSYPAQGEDKTLISGSLQQYTPQQRQIPDANIAAPTVWATGNSYVLQQETEASELQLSELIKSDPGPQWLLVNRVLERTFHGAIASQKDVTDQVETTLWDTNEILPIAIFNNQGENQCDFVGFEPYEGYQSNWRLTNSGANLADYIVPGDAYTGSSSFKLTTNNTLERITPLQQSQTAIVSAWVKSETGFLADSGSVYLETTAGANSTNRVAIELDSEEEWLYWQAVVDYSGDSTQSLSLAFRNDKGSTYLLFNNISVTPLASEMEVKFYDLVYYDEIASMGNNANIRRYAYNPLRQKFAEVGPGENPKQGSLSYGTRAWNNPTPFEYPKNDPSSRCHVLAAEGGIYETFTNGEQVWNNWQRDNTDAWQVNNGQLYHIGTALNTVQWRPTASTGTYAVGLTLTSPNTEHLLLEIAIGDAVRAKWQSESGWSLELDGTTHTNSAINGKVPTTIMVVPVTGAVLLFADGRQVFAVESTTPIVGELTLSAQGEWQFANPVTYLSPQISMVYKNANRNEIQSQVLNGTRCLVKETRYNPLGNTIAETKIASFNNTLFGYRSGFVTNLDTTTGVMMGEVSDYYPEDEGYPYNGTLYEASALGRPLKKGLPGKAFAITDNNSHTTQFNYEVTDQESVAGISYRAGEFLVTATIDANGSTVLEIKDRRGQTLGKQTNVGETMLDGVQQVFDSAGNITQILHPNYFSAESDASAFVTQNRYNFLGQLTSRITQDSGEIKYIYDPAGRVRFSSTPLTVEKGTVLYRKYDSLGRIYEEGEITQEWGDGSELQAIADSNPQYPDNNPWQTQNIYDGSGEDITLRNRLWKTQKRTQDDAIVENLYGYDLYGNVTQSSLNLPGQSPQSTAYAYNNLGNILGVEYPDSAPIPKVVYTYNQIGQNTAIGTPDEPVKFAQYDYNADGSLAQEQLNSAGSPALRRVIAYNSPGWITEIDNQYGDGGQILKHSFSYTSGGYDGAAYYNGNIASISNQNAIAPDNSFDYLYKYDARGQLEVAQHSTNPAYSLGVSNPIAFDPNGNIRIIQQGDTVQTYDYQENSNKVTTVEIDGAIAQSYDYDAVGNVTTSSYRSISAIEYNALNNLPLSVTKEDSSSLEFTYNGINQRVIKQLSDGSQTIYVHGLSDYPLMEIGEQISQYIYGVGGLLVIVEENESNYVLKDQQGSVRAVVAADGTVKTMLDYMPFGQLLPNSYNDANAIRYRYTGQEFDRELGLYNYRARFYDPQLRRFYSCDPKFQYGSPFAYCHNNPINRTDPSGEIADILVILIIGAVIGAAVGAGVAAYTGVKSGLKGGDLVGYIFAGAAIGAAAGALSAAGGVGAFAAGSAAAAAATTTAGGIAAGVAAGAGVGAGVGAVVGAAQGVSQHFVNDAFGVENAGTWQQSLFSGAITGAIGGAIAGGVAGYGGALAVQQSARYLQITGNNGWAYSPRSLTQVSKAYNSFGDMARIPLPSFVSRIPNLNLPVVGGAQSFVLGKFSLPTIASAAGAIAKKAVEPLLPTANDSSSNTQKQQATPQSQMSDYYGQQAYNPAMSGSVGMVSALVINPSYWNNNSEQSPSLS
ncbi:RHS repeat domain-containing protein [Coleofasciculus sp. G2-EDA-02]|uniref:RHS repeat domain-containing protein n=1 Tax=Coleofasciculus sp. G2-EDA-02 TaxID=3069529 RepID=UPI0032FD0789